MVRYRGPQFRNVLAPTHLEVLRVPRPDDPWSDRLPEEVEEHVMLLLYDPAWRGSWGWGETNRPPPGLIIKGDTAGVLIFRAAPLPGPIPPPLDLRREPSSFLADCVFLVTSRCYRSCTIVGLEGLPSHHLAAELGLSEEEVAVADSDDGRWAKTLAQRAQVWFREENFVPEEEPDDYIEVLTMDEYRAHVGEERFRLTTLSDGIPPHFEL
jgi:hypothetical protein